VTTPDPGLDLATLRGLRTPSARAGAAAVADITARIEAHLAAHHGYVAFSGGKDTLVAGDLARQVEPDVPVVFFDSGLDYPETYDYLTELAQTWRLDLHRIPTDPPLLDILADSGALGPHRPHRHRGRGGGPARGADHPPARRAHQLLGPGELWGVRADESAARRHLYTRGGRRDGLIARADGTIAYGPIWNWTTDDVWAHITRHQLPANPVYARLRQLGVPEHQHRITHVIDGNHLDRGRLTWLRRGWPTLFRATRRHPAPDPETHLTRPMHRHSATPVSPGETTRPRRVSGRCLGEDVGSRREIGERLVHHPHNRQDHRLLDVMEVLPGPSGDCLRSFGSRSEEPGDPGIAVTPVEQFLPGAPIVARLGHGDGVLGGSADHVLPFSSNAPPPMVTVSPGAWRGFRPR
jgi:phosphoadenosine phosphosulfate reductase